MIVCTSKSATLLGQGFGKDRVGILRLESILENLTIDPKLSGSKEAFIITSDDIRQPKVKKQFLNAAKNKHKDVIILYISRVTKSDITEGAGINKVLVKPKAADVANAVNALVESILNKAPLEYDDSTESGIKKFIPDEFIEEETTNVITEVQNTQEEDIVLPDTLPEEEAQQEPTGNRNSMVDRIKGCGTVADIRALTQEMKASKLLKDLVLENQQYTEIDGQLRAIHEKIRAVLLDQSIGSLEEKLSKVESILIDKDYYRSKSNSLIEQRVEEIISTILKTVSSTLNQRLSELDNAIVQIANKQKEAMQTTRLAGLNEERANIILELSTLSIEIRKIFANTDDLACDVVTMLSESEADLTGSQHINAMLTLRGNQYASLLNSEDGELDNEEVKRNMELVSGATFDSILKILQTADKTSDEFKQALEDIEVMQMKLNRLLELDNETILAYETIDRYMRENNIEDTVIAETLIKKSMRIFIAEEGTGRSVIPLTLSAMKSRSNANTMLLDLTGTTKYANYGEESLLLADWMDSRLEKEFCVVTGVIENVEYTQRLLTALTKAAEYYRVINIVLSPEQRDLFDVLAPDAISVTYLVDSYTKSINVMRNVIAETKLNNVARKVIINRAVSGNNTNILESLGLLNVDDVRYMVLPYIPQLVECSLRCIKPYDVKSVLTQFKAVSKYA